MQIIAATTGLYIYSSTLTFNLLIVFYYEIMTKRLFMAPREIWNGFVSFAEVIFGLRLIE